MEAEWKDNGGSEMTTEDEKWLLWISGEHAESILTLMFTKP